MPRIFNVVVGPKTAAWLLNTAAKKKKKMCESPSHCKTCICEGNHGFFLVLCRAKLLLWVIFRWRQQLVPGRVNPLIGCTADCIGLQGNCLSSRQGYIFATGRHWRGGLSFLFFFPRKRGFHTSNKLWDIGIKKNKFFKFLRTIVFLWSGIYLRVLVWRRQFLPHEVCWAEAEILRHLRVFVQQKWLGVATVCTMYRWLAWLKSMNHNDYSIKKKKLGIFPVFFLLPVGSFGNI